MKKSSNKGFTLVELIIVIAILAIIMLIAIPNFSGIQQRMQVRADKATAAQIGKAVRVWFTDYTTDSTMDVEKDASSNDLTIPSGLSVPTATGDVDVVSYNKLSHIENYISEGQTAKSLLDKDGKNITGYYCVFLTAASTNADAKVAVAICPSETAAQSEVKGVTVADSVVTVTADYDGNTGKTENGAGVAYVEP